MRTNRNNRDLPAAASSRREGEEPKGHVDTYAYQMEYISIIPLTDSSNIIVCLLIDILDYSMNLMSTAVYIDITDIGLGQSIATACVDLRGLTSVSTIYSDITRLQCKTLSKMDKQAVRSIHFLRLCMICLIVVFRNRAELPANVKLSLSDPRLAYSRAYPPISGGSRFC